MAVETKYVCDQCGAVQDTPKQMWNVVLQCNAFPEGYSVYSKTHHQALWCRACVERFGLLPNRELPPEQVHQNVTLEELVREIVRETIAEGGGN